MTLLNLGRRNSVKRKIVLESLENRWTMCADGGHASLELLNSSLLGTYPAITDNVLVAAPAPTTSTIVASNNTGLIVPAYHSLQGATDSLYLDFNGHFDSVWGSYSNVDTPAYDIDGNPGAFSITELDRIQQIWAQVAEDYAPFNIDVTTVEPASFANSVSMRVAIGGDGAWLGGSYGGVAYVDSYTNSITNTVYVFPVNLGSGNAKYVSEASSHESGHSFGLQHQSTYDASGTKTNEYNPGSSEKSPIMGNSYSATRGTWWHGTSATSASTYQDDMLVISKSANTFGYRADDHGNTAGLATPLAQSGSYVNGSGIISTTSDADYCSFNSDPGSISFNVDVPLNNNLDAVLQLRDAGGNLLTSAAPSTSFGASITFAIPAAGSYRLVVSSQGTYGDVGQYTVSGTIVPATSLVTAPSGLNASVVSGVVNLQWTDNATNETFYSVERSLDGATWLALTTLGANATSYADAAVASGGTYSYRVQAGNATANSAYSNTSTATLAPAAPSSLTALASGSGTIQLTWADTSGESSYALQRSLDGNSWSQVASISANNTSYSDGSLAANTKYYYRLQAINSGGASPFGNVASATTNPLPAPPAAPTSLVAVAVSKFSVRLSWIDNASNESGFYVERRLGSTGSFSVIATVAANSTIFTDNSVSRNKTYSYRLRAFNDGGVSTYTNTASVTTPRNSDTPKIGAVIASQESAPQSPVVISSVAVDFVFAASARKQTSADNDLASLFVELSAKLL